MTPRQKPNALNEIPAVQSSGARAWILWPGWVPLVLALAAGLPSLRGGFLTGDDYHLVRNHVLVNHPSLAHAAELFTIVHRDLYQPIPLLSFSLDFAILRALGLNPTADGPHAGAWVFHLTNVLIHAINTLLVLAVVRRVDGRGSVAFWVAVLFAVHPLAGEPVAWLNGRMLMLSTCFTLATVIVLHRWNDKSTAFGAVAVIVLAAAAHMSKVSVAIPVLAIIPFVARRTWPRRSWWVLWGCVAAMALAFTTFAVHSSGEMFERAEREMDGPPILYVALALGQYFRHLLAPVGLSAWYPPPPDVSWADASVIWSGGIVVLVFALTVLSAKWSRIGWLGLLWFMAAVLPTLPIIPARRAIAADRYVYLSNIGLLWIVVSLASWSLGLAIGRASVPVGRMMRAGAGVVTAVFIGVLLSATWRTIAHYENNITLAQRIIACDPQYPSVYESAAWAYYREGRFDEAIDIALKDLELHPQEMACEVLQVVGMSQFRLGRMEEGLATLNRAIEANPDYGKCYTRRGRIHAAMGRRDEAIADYERGIEIMPYYNPGILALAQLYREANRTSDAMAAYERVLASNEYDVMAQLALAEMEIGGGQFEAAAERLKMLLSWMPENVIARANLGVCLEWLNETSQAEQAYQEAIRRDRLAVTAIVNLASLYVRMDRLDDARRLFLEYFSDQHDNLAFLIAFHDYCERVHSPGHAANAFAAALSRDPDNRRLEAWAHYTAAKAGKLTAGGEAETLAADAGDVKAVVQLTQVLIGLGGNDNDAAITATASLIQLDQPDPVDALDRLLADLETFSLADSENPWPYLLSAMVLNSRGRHDVSQMAFAEFLRLCPNEECRARGERVFERQESGARAPDIGADLPFE